MAEIFLIPKEPSSDVVRMLENCLERARRGDVHGILIVQSWSDNTTNHCWAGVNDNAVRIVGEAMVAASSLAKNIDESRT